MESKKAVESQDEQPGIKTPRPADAELTDKDLDKVSGGVRGEKASGGVRRVTTGPGTQTEDEVYIG